MKNWYGIGLRSFLAAVMVTGLLACAEATEENQETENQVTDNQVTDNQETGNQEVDQIEVAGTWLTNFGDTEVIDNENWDFMAIALFDNEERFAITQNPDDAEPGPSTFNRLVWTEVENDIFYYCYDSFGHETEDEALNAEGTANQEDLDTGCGGFGFTEMTRQ